MAFQSYRSFNKYGTNNHRGWIYGGIGLGFYLASKRRIYDRRSIGSSGFLGIGGNVGKQQPTTIGPQGLSHVHSAW
eukprot:gene29834-36952_t